MNHSRRTRQSRDEGAILPLVLVMAVIIAVVIGALASYVTTSLKYGEVVEQRADRLAAADGGLRYAIVRLGNSQYAGCLSNLGNAGFKIDMPVQINESDIDITCTKGSNSISDIKAWAIVVTGAGVPGNQWMLQSQAGGGVQKLLGGPVWVSDPGRMDLKAPITVEDGDIWYYRADCANPSLTIDSNLTFTPAYRGTICVDQTWDQVYSAPAVGAFAGLTDLLNTNPAPTTNGTCKVFAPGRYTTMPALGANTYFRSGNYYFHNFKFDIVNAVVTAGWASSSLYGDQQFIANAPCAGAISADSTTSGSTPGATFYLGGSAAIEIGNKGSLEILRRLQGDSLVSIQALTTTNANQTASSLAYNNNIIWTKAGNNSDLAIHGLIWAPYAQMEFGNVTNSANGQLLGGAALSRIVLQASASASSFIIRVESSPIAYELRLDSTATKNGLSTTMTAVVQVDDQGTTAVNSLRVRD